MAKEEAIKTTGILKDINNDIFMVEVDMGTKKHLVQCKPSGKIRLHKIKLTNGDKVQLEMSPYDLNKGRITFRDK